MTLDWVRQTEHSSVSRCGRYSVSEIEGAWMAWRMAPGGPWFARLEGDVNSEQAAKDLCETDSERKR